MGVVRARGGACTHWQPSENATRCGSWRSRGGGVGVWAVGVVRARGGVGTHWQPLNTLNTKEMRASGEAGVGWGVGARGGEGAGGCGHALAAFKYFLNT